MNNSLRSILVVALAAGLTAPATAQPPFVGPDGPDGPVGPGSFVGVRVMLFRNQSVLKDLKLSEEQLQKLIEIDEKFREKHKDELEALSKLDNQEKREKGKELLKEADKAISEILKPEQAKRLKQIALQWLGGFAFNEEEIQKCLNLTGGQKDKIKTLNENMGKELQEIFQNAHGNFQAASKKAATLRKETIEKVVSHLTDDQKKAWKEMTGEPFEVKVEGPGGGFGGRRPTQDKDKAKDKQ